MTDTISFNDVLSARDRLRGIAHTTPVATSRTLDARTRRAVFLKCENLQRGGAFKFRGAYNLISRLTDDARRRGVVAYSSGNHAQGVALAARLLETPAIICMPSDAPAVKVEATRGYGAEIVFYDRMRDDRAALAQRIATEHGATLVPPYDHPHIMAGQGTAALELLEQVDGIDTLVVPVGGGGLISGCAIAAHGVNPAIQVIGVEPEDADDTRRSLEAGTRITIPPPTTIADGLRVTTPGALTFPIVQRHVAQIVTVSDDEIREAIRFVMLRMKLVVEPSGAAGVAAVLAGRLPDAARRVGVVVCGGNIDPPLLASLWEER
ncbi:threonine/serine dehydratase [Roseiflexus sp.]|uniref:threonine ammonia-lyase n=1 Tax=Roseiflexus sp. TaxID=2562120 RepID=UPI0021DC05CF|nr:threonine/serine dehydratase [Roseiflexus sp.]GIV98765.1 MAG: serine/threonine dehydratase [Roseiflexus sp.]